MWKFINDLSQERTFVRFQGEEVSLSDEDQYLSRILQAIEKKRCVSLLAFSNTVQIGSAVIEMGEMTERHEGSLGLSVAKEWRGEGIGSLLLRHIIEEGKAKIPTLHIITLSVFAQNRLAIELYKRFGFAEWGRLPGGMQYPDGRTDDRILMFKHI